MIHHVSVDELTTAMIIPRCLKVNQQY